MPTRPHPDDPASGDPGSSPNPWTTRSGRVVYDNPWISVREDQVIRPDGEPGVYGVVHFKNRAIGVLPVEQDGSIWLVGQHRYPLDAYSWEIPEGGGPLDETPEQAARRELVEETGLRADHLELIGTLHLSNSVSDEFGFIFRATGLVPGPSAPEGTERLAVRRVSWTEARAMLDRGEITDSLTVVALLREALRRAESSTGDGRLP
ncbi:NUDIX domain-containing protein [Tautonia plasticadhaerens]|uniref:ADP-ribose pyrophosphatase n=1 Tax=Tautonia plasticadhaerens TaxID=2527974 RepID=A0A518H7L7_9BACT|nr:NUDIX hydrolase [Tautonia plasticadhaerens]QDV36766.1 ADP-ribose pyrophosphatase [Tautonia plasticadhaerens]